MRDDLRPLSLTDAARSLGIDPFEVVRLLVASEAMPEGAPFLTAERVEALRELGGIEAAWWEGARLPEDANPRRRRLRAALALLAARGHVGTEATRLDNVTRGLPAAEQRFLGTALRALADDGLLSVEVRPVGVVVAIVASAAGRVRSIADGIETPASVAGLLGG